MRVAICLLTSLLALAIVTGAHGEDEVGDVKKEPGYVNLDFVEGLVGPKKASIEVFIQGPLLQMVSAAVGDEDPDLGKLLRKLKMIRVQVFKGVGGPEAERIEQRAAEITKGLQEDGWEGVVRLRHEDEGPTAIDMLVKTVKDSIAGLAVFVVGPEEVVFVNIVGEFDPALLGQLSGAFGMPQMPALNMVPSEGPAEKEEASPLPKMEEQGEASAKEREAAPSEGSEP